MIDIPSVFKIDYGLFKDHLDKILDLFHPLPLSTILLNKTNYRTHAIINRSQITAPLNFHWKIDFLCVFYFTIWRQKQ